MNFVLSPMFSHVMSSQCTNFVICRNLYNHQTFFMHETKEKLIKGKNICFMKSALGY